MSTPPSASVGSDLRSRFLRVDLGGPPPSRRELQLVGLAIGLSIVVAVVYWVLLRDVGLAGDELHYDGAGRLAAAGHWFWGTSPFGNPHPTVWKPPGYPLWIQFWYSVVGAHPRVVEGIQLAVFGPLTVGLTWLFARRLVGDTRVAVAAALVVAVYPMAWQYQGLLYPEALAIPAGLVLLIVGLGRPMTLRRTAAVGALTGLNLLIRPSALFLLAAVLVAWLVAHGLRRAVLAAVIAAAAAALVIAPWTIRNAIVTDRFVVLSVQDLAVSGTFNDSAAHDQRFPWLWRAVPERDIDVTRRRPPLTDVELRDVLKSRAYDYIRGHPDSVLKAFFWNGLSRLWDVRRPSNAIAETPFEGRIRGITIAALVGYYVMLPLGLLGLWRLRRRRDLLAGFLAAALMASLIFTIDSGTRYRAPLEPLLVILACTAVFGRLSEQTEFDDPHTG